MNPKPLERTAKGHLVDQLDGPRGRNAKREDHGLGGRAVLERLHIAPTLLHVRLEEVARHGVVGRGVAQRWALGGADLQ
jgi:hypothetical protein